MKSDFSEFGYGYTITEELQSTFGLGYTAPRFPTQHEEANEGGGYDVHLTDLVLPLFIQFKRPDVMVRSNATQADEFGTPYFRFELRTGKQASEVNQHRLLYQLAERFPERVAYMAPRFASYQEFDAAYQTGQVVEQSIWLTPTEIGDLADKSDHVVVYTADSTDPWVRRSDPKQGTPSTASSRLWELPARPVSVSDLLEITAKVAGNASAWRQGAHVAPEDPSVDREAALRLWRLSGWCRVTLDTYLLIAPARTPSQETDTAKKENDLGGSNASPP